MGEPKEKEIPGVLSHITLQPEERELFLDYMNRQKKMEVVDFLFAVLGENFLKFLDVFSGESIKIPQREEVIKIVNYVKIYKYCKSHNFTDEAYQKASVIFSRREMSIRRIVEKVSKVLEKEYSSDGD